MNLVITDAARDAILKFAETEFTVVNWPEWGVRVSVLPGGCSGFRYGLNIEEKPQTDDVVLTINGVTVYTDEFSMQYLDGVTVDYTNSIEGSGFSFTNPNATGGCG